MAIDFGENNKPDITINKINIVRQVSIQMYRLETDSIPICKL